MRTGLIISGASRQRSPVRALLASLGAPGLGQMYLGRLSRGILFSLSSCLAALLIPFGLLVRPDRPSLIIAVFMAFLYIAIIAVCHLDAVLGARAIRSFSPGKYNHPRAYLVFALCTLLLQALALLIAASFYSVAIVRTDAMEPSLFRGEAVLVARGPDIHWKGGDVVVYEDGGLPGLGRVAALPGDSVFESRGRLAVNGAFLSLGVFLDRDLDCLALPATEDLYYEIHGDRRYALRINLEKNNPNHSGAAVKTVEKETVVLYFDNRITRDAPIFKPRSFLRGRVEGILYGKSLRRTLLPPWDTP